MDAKTGGHPLGNIPYIYIKVVQLSKIFHINMYVGPKLIWPNITMGVNVNI